MPGNQNSELKTLRFLEPEDQIAAQSIWLAAKAGEFESFSEGYRKVFSGDAEFQGDLDEYIEGAIEIYNIHENIESSVEGESWNFEQDLYLFIDTADYLLEEDRYGELGELMDSFRSKYFE